MHAWLLTGRKLGWGVGVLCRTSFNRPYKVATYLPTDNWLTYSAAFMHPDEEVENGGSGVSDGLISTLVQWNSCLQLINRLSFYSLMAIKWIGAVPS